MFLIFFHFFAADELDLPPCVREDVAVVLSTAERAAYERLKREFLDAVKQYKRHQDASANFVRTQSNRTEENNRSRALAKATARAYATLISLRQSTCHPQMVASNAALMGSERLSMTDIIDRLVTQAYGEFDNAVRTFFDQRVYQIATAVCMKGEDPAEGFNSLLQAVDDNALIAGLMMLPRNRCIELRKENGTLSHADILNGDDGKRNSVGGDQAVEMLVRAKLAAMENKDIEECEQEDQELKERREVYKQQINETAENWDTENLEKEASKKKGGGKRPPSRTNNAGGGKKNTGVQNNNGEAAVKEDPSAARSGPSFKAKRYARDQLGPQPDLPPKRRQLRREAATRRRNWIRLRVAIFELKLHLIKEELGMVKGKWSSQAKTRAALRKESGKSDPGANLESTIQELDTLRAELGLIPDFAPGGNVAVGVPEGGASGSGALALEEGKGGASGGLGDAAHEVAAAKRDGDANDDPANAVGNNNDASGGAAGIDGNAAAAASLVDAAANIRRSRRQAGIDADSTTEILLDPEELAAQLENAISMVRQYKGICFGRDPEGLTRRHVETALNESKELFHRLKFVKQQHEDVTRMAKLTAAADNAHNEASGSGLKEEEDNGQEDLTRCPICFDDLTTTPLTMTRCSHRFCTDCIRESLERAAPQPAPCPICRTELRECDLFEALTEAEAVVEARAAAATNDATSEYGAKVAAALDILRDMQDSEGPGSKCLIFSSWGRALRLVGDALTANKVKFASLAGSVSTKRAALLNEFMHDPDCTVLLVLLNTSGGAAGLTLTMATTAILLEPCINPGLEAQAAARIYRMGQTRPTRVVRLIAEETVDCEIAQQQRRKLKAGDAAAGNIKTDEADYGTIVALAERLAASTTGGKGDVVMEEDAGPAPARIDGGGNDGAGPSRPPPRLLDI